MGLSELRRLPELTPEPVETVTSTGNPETAAPLWLQDTDRWGLLARYSELTEAIEAGCKAKPLYREDRAIFTMPAGIGTVVDMKPWGDRLYCATTGNLVVVRVS